MYEPLISEDNPHNLESPSTGVVCGTRPRHLASTMTSLRICKNPGPQLTLLHSTVLSMSNGQRLYKLAVDVGVPRDTKFVCDGFTGAPLVRMKGPSLTFLKSKFHMRTGDDAKEIISKCDLKVGGSKVKLLVQFQDVLMPQIHHELVLKGSRWSRNFDIFSGPRKIAKIVSPQFKMEGCKRRDRYHVHIAQGVDVAMILAMLLAVDTYLSNWI